MNLEQAYQEIWRKKLEGAKPPDQQHIPRVTWTVKLFPSDAKGPLLDIGCGSGQMLAEAKQRGWEALGIDRSPEVIAWLITQGYTVRVWDIDSSDAIPTALTYRIVTLCDVIEHLIDPMHALREAYEVLEPGGRIYVGTPNACHWRRLFSLMQGFMFRTSGDDVLRDGGHVAYFGPVDLSAALELAGFRDCQIHFRSQDELPVESIFSGLSDMRSSEKEKWEYTYLIAEGVKP